MFEDEETLEDIKNRSPSYDYDNINNYIDIIFKQHRLTCRPVQREVIHNIIKAFTNGKTSVVLEAPTGVGKSYIAYTIARIMNTFNIRATITTGTIPLQQQYLRDFNDISNLMSSSNYKCSKLPTVSKYNDNECTMLCDLNVCNPKHECEYVIDRNIWMNESNIRITNNAYLIKAGVFLVNTKYTFTGFTVYDECHNLNSTLLNNSAMTLDKECICKLLDDFDYTLFKDKEGNINNNVNNVKNKFKENILEFYNVITSSIDSYNSLIIGDKIVNLIRELYINNISLNGYFILLAKSIKKEFINSHDGEITKLRDTNDKLNIMRKLRYPKNLTKITKELERIHQVFDILHRIESDNNATLILLDSSDTFITFNLNIARYIAYDSLFKKTKYKLFMSATICGIDQFMYELGLSRDETEYIQVPSPFPIENRRICFNSIVNFSNYNKDNSLDKIAKYLIPILNETKTRSIIHTVSFYNANKLIELFPDNLRSRCVENNSIREFYSKFKNNEFSNDAIFIGPNLTEGLDFKDDLCRIQFIIKLPYLSLEDRITKYNMDMIPGFYDREMIKTLCQAYGRGCRNMNDYCLTLILDGNFNRYKNTALLPLWVKDAII